MKPSVKLTPSQFEALKALETGSSGELMRDRTGWGRSRGFSSWRATPQTITALEKRGLVAIDGLGGCMGVAVITRRGRAALAEARASWAASWGAAGR